MSDKRLNIELLTEHHDRQSFSCGIDALDKYLIKEATQYRKRGLAQTYVLTPDNSDAVIGYYTLSATSINLEALPESVSKKLPRHPLVPSTLLGRLAVSKEHQKKNYGELLLLDALRVSFDISQRVASVAVTVDAENEKVIKFYKKYEFMELTDCKTKLYLPMKTIAKLFPISTDKP